ncbi:MAG TPA: ferritin-like domain-containing protein [Bryobacteraceae bacterium]|nr:ferritin-like domain-containing protein [Bryobacteraceae bacterium]
MLRELLVEELRDLYHAEGQLVKALPKMAKAAKSPKLKEAIQRHLTETEGHVERLQKAFELLGEKQKAKPCKGMMGIVEEGREVIEEGKRRDEIDADLALIGAAQRVEHYEIAAYGTARAMAERLGEDRLVRLLSQTLQEEENADQKLTKIAEPMLRESETGGEEEEDEEMEMEEEEEEV